MGRPDYTGGWLSTSWASCEIIVNWEAIAAIGEIVGGAGVVGSLVFVGWQLLQNTAALRTSTSQSHVELYSSLAAQISGNREVATLWLAGLSDLSSLEDVDRVRFISLTSAIFRFYETSFVQHTKGKLDEELWGNVEKQLRDMVTAPGVRSWWEMRRHWHSAQFSSLVDSLMTSGGGKSLYERRGG